VREEKDLRFKVKVKVNNFLTSTFLSLGSEEALARGTNRATSMSTSNSSDGSSSDGSSMNSGSGSSNVSSDIKTITDSHTSSTKLETEATEAANTLIATLTTTIPINTTEVDDENNENLVDDSTSSNQTQTSETFNNSIQITEIQSSNSANELVDKPPTDLTIDSTTLQNTTSIKSITKSDNIDKSATSVTANNSNRTTSEGGEEIISPERIERRRTDEKISSKNFSLWKIVNGDRKIVQDEEGNYLLPNDLGNYPKSKYSFWDILGYAQTQKSIKAPAGFAVNAYYSGKMDNNPTFNKYLAEKANSLIGAARKPKEPTEIVDSETIETIKAEYARTLMIENLREKLWDELPKEGQESLIAAKVCKLQSGHLFKSYYKHWSDEQLREHAINQVKKELANAEIERKQNELALAS
jgi:hypothetical protein